MLKNNMDKLLRKEIIAPIIIVLICILICSLSKKIINKIFSFKSKRINDNKKKTIVNLINNIVKFIIVIVCILIILEIYGIDTKSMVTSLGVVGLVAGLALQDLLKDFIVGMTIIFEGEFLVGDWVSINGFKGEILPSNLRTTKLKAYTGEVKIISNRNITEIINYSLENTTLIVDVNVAYESDIKKVKKVLNDLSENLKVKYNLKEMKCLGVQDLSSSSIVFRLVVLSKYYEHFEIDRKIKEEIVLEFSKQNITIPYNQVVVRNG